MSLADVPKFGEILTTDGIASIEFHQFLEDLARLGSRLSSASASIHAIVSDSANDADGGTGAYSVRVYGLADWEAPETSEIVMLDGITPVNTVGAYVIINRMVCIYGVNSTGPNAGIITATPAAVAVAQILVGAGET